MNVVARARGLSISARSFLLVFVALVIAAVLALVLVFNRPPLRNAPVSIGEIASLLRVAGDPEAVRREPRGPPEDWNREFRGSNAGPPRGPREFELQGDSGRGPPGPGEDRGPGQDDPMRGPREQRQPDGGMMSRGFERGPPQPRRKELVTTVETAKPAALRDRDASVSDAATSALAARLGLSAESVTLQVPREAVMPGVRERRLDERSQIGEGFVAARLLDDGTWRVVTSVVQGFPNALHRQAMLLGVIGLALMLPLAWLFARALAAPLRRFALGAQRLGRDPGAPPLPSEGPREMRAAVDAFNTMQARVNRLLQERTQMVAAIAHDLRTPLTRLAFRLESLPAPLVDKVNADIDEMKAMISAALDFIRDRAMVGTRERVDLRLLLERIVDDQSDLGQDVTLDPGPPVILEGVPLALRRMVVNIVENALKYGARARLRLQVREGAAIVEVDDDGPGIPENRQQQVFEPFFRLEASRNRDTGGIGLGLATVRAIVNDHGGEIALGNRSGGGLRVTISLPLPE